MDASTKHTLGDEGVSVIDAVNDDDLKVLPPLTDRQAECLMYLLTYFSEFRYYPTQREIAKKMKLKTNSAATFLEPLRKKGYLEKEPGRNRNIRLTNLAIHKLRLMNNSKKNKKGQ